VKRITASLVVLSLISAGCGNNGSETGTVTLLTHESFDIGEDVLAEFTRETGWEVEVLAAGDAGQMINQAILSAGNPVADVLFGVDNTFLSRAIDAELFVPYRSLRIDDVAAGLDLDEHVTPVDFGDVCINIDSASFSEGEAPQTLADLAAPEHRGRLVVENPASSSPGLAFLLSTIVVFGDSGPYTWRDYWADLRDNDVAVASGWEDAYYGIFSGGSGAGDRPLVVSYASSPPAEVVFAAVPTDEAPTEVMTDGCFRQIEFAGILRGTDQRDAAADLIDFMLSPAFQEDIPLRMFVFPATGAALPEVFLDHTVVPENPVLMSPDLIESNREDWIREWTAIVLR
jgi:thiamine transport system substrate-binding protein